MKEFDVTITETLRKTVSVKAESLEEAEQLVSDQWHNSEYILDADDFEGATFTGEEKPYDVEMNYGQMRSLFRKAENNKMHITGYIVFTADSFEKPYDERSRTYAVSSNNKAFQPNMGGYSIYASCIDGTDFGVRLEGYMSCERGGENGWKIERCYMKSDERDRVLHCKPEKEPER